jgi:transaldolase
MHISKFSTKIFLDSGDPSHTKDVLATLGFLDGQTTNPSLVAKSEVIRKLQEKGNINEDELMEGYKDIVNQIHNFIPGGSVSIEVYADADTTSQEMINQAESFSQWIPQPHIKLPITMAGLEAAEYLVGQGMNINMTLCFSQEQAVAVHYATRNAISGQVFVSPFLGRLDDQGVCGVSLIQNIRKAYDALGSHVEILAASIRSVSHISECVVAGADILTIPYKLFGPWGEKGFEITDVPLCENLESLTYHQNIQDDWREINIQHDLTDTGLAKFAADWKSIINNK